MLEQLELISLMNLPLSLHSCSGIPCSCSALDTAPGKAITMMIVWLHPHFPHSREGNVGFLGHVEQFWPSKAKQIITIPQLLKILALDEDILEMSSVCSFSFCGEGKIMAMPSVR